MIGFLGPEASFTHAAANRLFIGDKSLVSLPNITEVFKALKEGRISYGVVPIENSTHGVVRETIDQLLLDEQPKGQCSLDDVRSPILIERELALPIRHHLLASSKEPQVFEPKRIVSHGQALAQCKKYLDTHYPLVSRIAVDSTASAAAQAEDDPYTWAVGSELAGNKYGLVTIAANIHDCKQNTTRFIAIGKQLRFPTASDRTSFVFTTPHEKGALLSVLQILSDAGINLTRIESRPLVGAGWEYCFVVEVEGHESLAPLNRVLEQLLLRKSLVKLLGSYPFSSAE